jgi:hypothetical protein
LASSSGPQGYAAPATGRRECFGELVQIDGCKQHWFEDRGRECVLLVYVDDATSKLMELRFVLTESAFDYFDATRSSRCRPTA